MGLGPGAGAGDLCVPRRKSGTACTRAGRSPLELRRLLLSGEVVALRSGEGSVCVAEAARVALPLRMSMTCEKMGVTTRPPPLPRPSPSSRPGRTHPAAAGHHERSVVVTILEAAVGAAADQGAHERQEPAARRRVQRRAARVHLRVHVGAVLRGSGPGSGAAGPGRGGLGGPRSGSRREWGAGRTARGPFPPATAAAPC